MCLIWKHLLLYWLHNQLTENPWDAKVSEFSVIQVVVEAVVVTCTAYEVCVKLGWRPLWGSLQHHVKDKSSRKERRVQLCRGRWWKKLGEGVRCCRETWDPKCFEFGEDCYDPGSPWWLSGKEPSCQCRRCKFDPSVGKIWRRKWQSTLVFSPGKSHGHKSLLCYSPWGCKIIVHDLVAKQQHIMTLGNWFSGVQADHLYQNQVSYWIKILILQVSFQTA